MSDRSVGSKTTYFEALKTAYTQYEERVYMYYKGVYA